MPTEQQTLETWEQKAKRLALELKALTQWHKPPNKHSLQTARAYRKKRYEMWNHIEAVTEDD